jgi:5'-nucleotidase
MRILLTNDDGIHAEGLQVLERIARQLADEVWVVAPETDQSGFAHSLSLSDPLRMRKVQDRHYAVRGTPTDCVIMGVRKLMKDNPPDLILSGVNSGSNIADDVTYSGTIAGAMEGTLLGIRSIALSQGYSVSEDGRAVLWETAERHAPDLLGKLIGLSFPHNVFLNLNFPNCPPDEVQGVEVTSQGRMSHGLSLEERHDGRGFPYFWLRFGRSDAQAGEGTDIAALRDNRISVTPLHMDLTAHAEKDRLRKALG